MHRKRRWITRVRILIVSAALQRNGCEHGKRPPLCVEALTAARHQKGAHRQSSPKPNRLTGSAGLTRPRVSRGRSPVPPSGTSATRGPAADHHQFRPESRKTQSPASLHLRVCCALRLDARSQSLATDDARSQSLRTELRTIYPSFGPAINCATPCRGFATNKIAKRCDFVLELLSFIGLVTRP